MPKLKNGQDTNTIVSVEKVNEISKLLAQGKSKQYVIDYAVEHFCVGLPQARRYYSSAVKNLMPKNPEKYREGLIQTNFNRLETIVERAMEEGDWKNAREAIAEMNKMCGLTNGGFQIGIATDKANDTQQVIIKFDQ